MWWWMSASYPPPPHHHHHHHTNTISHSTSSVAASRSNCNTNALFPRLESFTGITTIDVSSKTSPTIVGSLPLLGARAGVLLPGGTHMAVTLFSQDKLCSVRAMGNGMTDRRRMLRNGRLLLVANVLWTPGCVTLALVSCKVHRLMMTLR
jgi:hypothetical protein